MKREPERHVVCGAHEIPPGGRRIVRIAGRSIGIFNVDGEYHAIRNICPHQGAELCRGIVGGTMLPAGPGEYRYGLAGRVLRCPWHFWEFDITTGKMIFVPDPMRVRTYRVAVEPRVEAEAPRLEKYPAAVEDRMVVLYV